MTIGELLPIYERNHVAFLKSQRGTSRRLQKYVRRLAAVDLADLRRIQIMDWFHAIAQTDGPHAANHAVQDLHALYARAKDWELYDGKNPADRIKKFPKHSRERFIQSHEMPYILASIEEELPRTAVFFLTLLLTGVRRGEARTMKWADLDLPAGLWHIPTTKTGVPHTVPLPAQLVTRLQALPRINEWVFPSCSNNKNRHHRGQWCGTAVTYHWKRIRARAGLNDVRIHDLRRTAASWLAISGANLPVIQRMLNHTSLTSTQVYARLSIAPVRQALEGQAERILGTVPVVHGNGHEPAQEWPG